MALGIFTELGEAAGLRFIHFNGMSGELYFPEPMGTGVALLDFDGDGDLDVFFPQGALLGQGKSLDDAIFNPTPPLPPSDRLFRNDLGFSPAGNPRMRFVDVTESSGIRGLGYGMGVAVADYDNDGLPDVYVTNVGANRLWRNNGDGTFSDVTAASGTGDSRWGIGASFFDMDSDGRLDLYVANYVIYSTEKDTPCYSRTSAQDYCAPERYPSATDTLFRSRGDGTFEDVSGASGIEAVPRPGMGVVAADFDQDGATDLYVTNDRQPNLLWINQGDGTFSDAALLSGSAVNRSGRPEASMGVEAEDFDGDGDLDLFMTHLLNETNTLFRNSGNGLFEDATLESGLGPPSLPKTGFGVAAIDYDNDGRLDLLVANGSVQVVEALARRGDPYPLSQFSQLFRNVGGARFEDVSPQAGTWASELRVARGLASGDLDNDGDPDVVISNNSAPAWLLRNEIGDTSHWTGVHLRGPGAAVQGAEVTITAGGKAHRRRVHTDGSYGSARDPRVLVGLGGTDNGVSVVVHRKGQAPQRFLDVPVDRYLVIPAPSPAQ